MINLPGARTGRQPAPMPPATVPIADERPGVSSLADLPPELWLLSGRYLPANDQADFFSAHPQAVLANDAQAAAAVATISGTPDVTVISGLVAQSRDLPPLQRSRVLAQAIRSGCARLHRCACGPAEQPLHDLLNACLEAADTLPPRLRNRMLAGLLLRLPHPYCDRSDFVPARHGAFATRLVTGLLAAARSGDAFVCRAVARSERGLPRLIDLEYGVAPGLGHGPERKARATGFMEVLAQPETVAGGDVGPALATAASLVSYFFPDRLPEHLPLMQRLVRTPATASNIVGLRCLAEIVDDLPDPAARTALMCEMVASSQAGAQKQGPTAVRDALACMARNLRRTAEALEPRQRALVNAAFETAGFQGAPL
jgi:hypothetical protein